MSDQNLNDDEFEIEDGFEESDWQDDSSDTSIDDTMPPPKKKGSSLVFNLIILGMVGGGLFFAKDTILSSLGLQQPTNNIETAAAPAPLDTPGIPGAIPSDNTPASHSPFDTSSIDDTNNGAFSGLPPQPSEDTTLITAEQNSVQIPFSNPGIEADVAPTVIDQQVDTYGSLAADDTWNTDIQSPDNAFANQEPIQADLPNFEQSGDTQDLAPIPTIDNAPDDIFSTLQEGDNNAFSGEDLFANAEGENTDPIENIPVDTLTDSFDPSEMTRLQTDLDNANAKIEEQHTDIQTLQTENTQLNAENIRLTSEIKALKKKSAKKTHKKANTQKSAPVKAKPKAHKNWVLRSAKPGVAWISEKNSNDLKKIKVGDTISGLGNIQSITHTRSQGWVIQASLGSLKQ